MTSEWSPKIDRPCAARARALTCTVKRQQLARDLVQVRDHQQQPLRRREGRRQRAAEQPAVHGAGHAPLGLHLDDPGTWPQRFGLPAAAHSSQTPPSARTA
jgi:hypothetical protein